MKCIYEGKVHTRTIFTYSFIVRVEVFLMFVCWQRVCMSVKCLVCPDLLFFVRLFFIKSKFLFIYDIYNFPYVLCIFLSFQTEKTLAELMFR